MENYATKMGATGIHVGSKMFQEGAYVIGEWATTDGHSAGQALAKINGTKLDLLKMGGGSMNSLAWLEQVGVPPTNAKALVSDLTKAGF